MLPPGENKAVDSGAAAAHRDSPEGLWAYRVTVTGAGDDETAFSVAVASIALRRPLGCSAHEHILSKAGIHPVKQFNISHINRVFR